MANTADLKAKIEANPTGFSITDDEILLYLEQGLNGSFEIESEQAQSIFIAGAFVTAVYNAIAGNDGNQQVNIGGTFKYSDLFETRFSVIAKEKSYENLSYNQLRLAVTYFDENSDEFKEVVKNLTNDVLGPALDQYSFSNFDVAVSTEVNNKFQSGNSFPLNDLPTLTVGGTPSVVIPDFPNDTVPEIRPLMEAAKFSEIVAAYSAQNGSDITKPSGQIRASDSLRLNGNLSGINTEFQIAEVAAGGKGPIDAILDFFTDYESPSSLLNYRYKSFLVQSLRDPVKIDRFYNEEVERTALKMTYNFLYDFEYERREGLYRSIKDDPTAEVEDLLANAEIAALDSLADSGLAGEGGITQDLSPEEIEERQRFFEQCALLATMDSFQDVFVKSIQKEGETDDDEAEAADTTATPSGEKMHQPSPYQERFYMVAAPNGRNDRLVNFLNAPSDELINDFLNLTPDIQAFLAPKLRLYKVFNEGDRLKQVEFIFKNSTDSTNLLRQMFNDNDRFFRGSGYGIKSFSYSFNGTTPATAKNDITADLTLYFQDFTDFVTPVQTSEGTFKFVDLIFYDKRNENNPTYGYGSSHPDQYSPAYFRIRADVGWHVPKDQIQFDEACRKRNIDPDNVRDVIEKTNKSYYLNMVEHELDFKKDGTVEIKAQYRGYIESVLKGTTMDALTDKEIIDDRKSRQLQLETAKRTCTPGELAQIKRIYAAEEQLIIQDLYQRTYKRLLDLNKVRTFSVDPGGGDGGFRKNGYFSREPKIFDEGAAAVGDITDEHTYYFLGDLLYVMLDAMYVDSKFAEPLGKTKFILPTIEFENFFKDSQAFSINIAAIPISHRYFSEWWTEHVVKAKKRSYPIMFYLRDLLNSLIADALIDTCLNRNYNKSFNFQTTTVNASDDPLSSTANARNPIINLDQNKLPFTVTEDADINDITNYILVFAAHSTTLPSGVGKYTEDLENGVYHFHLGQDRGLINDVKFNKVDMSYIREARFQREGVEGLLQLGAVYRASINMFGNTLFYPGMLIYINPFGIGGEEFLPNKEGTIANQLGLGGYHLIEKVNSTIAAGTFKTSIEAMFVYSGDGDVRVKLQGKQKESDEDNVEEPTTEPPKCASLVAAVRADYLNTLAGQETELAEQASLDANAENLRNTLSNAGATDIPPPEAPPAPSTTGIPETGVNTGLSPEDLLDQQQQLVNFLGFDPTNPTGGSQ